MKNVMSLFMLVLFLSACSKKDLIAPDKTQADGFGILVKQPYVTPEFTYENAPIDPLLKASGKGVIKVPVVVINYLPTSDGVNLDRWRTANSKGVYDNNSKYSLQRAKQKILTEKIIEKRYIEQGSRYHDYGADTAKQYVDVDVVAYINITDVKYIKTDSSLTDTTVDYKSLSTGGQQHDVDTLSKMYFYKVDFNELFTRINLQNYVEALGVKEVWFTSFIREVGSNAYNVSESNMNGPYGNISNGGSEPLPRYNKSYVVYGFNGWRGADTDLHNRGHQIERQMMEMDMTTWLNFTKRSDGIITHYAPNTNESYHYGHTQTAKSDIMTWKPTGGTFVDVNVYTWLNLKYPFESQINMVSPNYSPLSTGILDYRSDISNCNGDPNDKLGATTEIKYHVFWWQCMPGYNAKVNWWDVFYNWDNAKKNKTKLY